MNDKVIPAEQDARFLSSNCDISYLRTLIMPNVQHRAQKQLDLTYEPGSKFNKDWIDPLSREMRSLLRLDKSKMQRMVYTNQRITSLAYDLYGNTSLWYPILLINGYCHPHEIPSGAVLYLPTLSDLNTILRVKPQSTRGTIVRT